MKKRKKVIWFVEEGWTKQHAAIGISANSTMCGILRSTRKISRSEVYWRTLNKYYRCKKCLKGLRKHFGATDVVEVYIKED